jgi:hypothetical protein
MAISVRTRTDPAKMATAWTAGMGAGGTKWGNGLRNPRKLPNADPAKNAAAWQTGVAAALPAFTAGISSPSYLTKLEAGIPAGQSKFSSAGTSRAPQAQSAFTKLAPMIDEVVAGLPAKGPKGTNSNRAAAFGDAMHQKKGQAKAS